MSLTQNPTRFGTRTDSQKVDYSKEIDFLFKLNNTIQSSKDIKVQESNGWIAKTNMKAIYLNLNQMKQLSKDNYFDFLIFLKGFNYHEMSHILFTKYGSDSPREIKRALNMLEDQRIETVFSQKYSKSKTYFRMLVLSYVLKEGIRADQYPLLYGRRLIIGKPEIMEDMRDMFVEKYGENITKQVEAIVDEYLVTLDVPRQRELARKMTDLLRQNIPESTAEPWLPSNDKKSVSNDEKDLTQQIQKEITKQKEEAAEQEKKESQPKESKPSDDANEEESEQDDASEKSDDSDSDSEDKTDNDDNEKSDETDSNDETKDSDSESDADGQDSDVDSDSETSDADSDGEGNSETDADGQETDEESDSKSEGSDGDGAGDKSVEDMMKDLLDDQKGEVEEEIERQMQIMEKSSFDGGEEVAINNSILVFNPEARHIRTMKHLQEQIKKMRNDLDNRTVYHQKKGKIDMRRAMMNTESYKTQDFKKFVPSRLNKTKLAVSILLDASGSMSADQFETAVSSGWAIANALEACGSKVKVYEFSDDFRVLKDFNVESKNSQWGRNFAGSTYPNAALKDAEISLEQIRKIDCIENHMVLIMTDGGFGDTQKVEATAKALKQKGVYVAVLNVGSAGQYSKRNDNYNKIVHVRSFSDLSKSMMEMVKDIQREAVRKVKTSSY